MEILVKGFTNNAGTYGNMCSCDCNCNCDGYVQGFEDEFYNDRLMCARKYGYGTCNRYTPRG